MFVRDFYQAKEHNYEDFFSGYVDNTALKKAKLEVKKAAKALAELNGIYLQELEKRYNSNFTPTKYNYIFRYTDRHGQDYYYDDVSGAVCINISEYENPVYINLDVKNGMVCIVVGYCFELGAVVVRKYNYHISTDNSRVNLIFTNEYLYPLIDENGIVKGITTGGDKPDEEIDKNRVTSYWNPEFQTALQRVNASEFIQEFYGLEKNFNFSLYQMNEYLVNNKSFETLIKIIDDNELLSFLLPLHSDKALPPYKLIKSDKPTWNYALEHNCVGALIQFKKKYPPANNNSKKLFDEAFHKTDMEWIDFLDKIAHWKEDLQFYGIHEPHLEDEIISAYAGLEYPYHNSNFHKYYGFNKFCNYVVEESINQGYTSVDNFLRTLKDYISMCEDLEIVPTLYSSYLSQTHDIVSRNHKISISASQEESFKDKYSDFKNFNTKDKKYSIVAPKCSFDLRKEGDDLNHCVASYIKRVIDGSCIILFLRYANSIGKSLVTFEIRGKSVVQARGIHNRDITNDERTALHQFCVDRHMTLNV